VSDGDGRDSPGLGASDFAGNPSSRLKTHFGDLGAFTAAGFPGNNDDLVFFDQPDDLIPLGGDREAVRKSNPGSVVEPMLSFLDRGLRLPFQAGKQIRIILHLVDSAKTTGQNVPVPQHGLGQEGADFMNAFF